MKRRNLTILISLLLICNLSYSQTLSVSTSLVQGTSSATPVKYNGVLHALEGAEATFAISLSTTDSIARVSSFTYTYNGITGNVSNTVSDGKISINSVVLSNLTRTSSNVSFECSLQYVTKRNDKDTTVTVSAAKGDPIHIYEKPTYSITEPTNYVYYKSTSSCNWTVNASGGGTWNYSWSTSDGTTSTSSYLYYSGTNYGSSKKTVTVSLKMVNYAPDGTTIWDSGITKNYTVEIYPTANVSVSPSTNYSFSREELFQDQTWTLTVASSGGYTTGWTYEWKDENGNVVGTGASYNLTSERSKSNINRTISVTVTNKGILTNGTSQSWFAARTYTWYATFIPCPVVDFSSTYPDDLIYGDNANMGFSITDDDGNSLLSDPAYSWNYKWDYNGYTYSTKTLNVTANNSSDDSGIKKTVTLTVTGTLSNSKVYTTTRTHEFTMWPTPSTSRPSSSPLNQDVCGGQTKTLSVTPIGGVKSGWRYYWYKNGSLVHEGTNNSYDASVVYSATGKVTATDTYYVEAQNICEGTIRYSNTWYYYFTKYPEPVISDKITLYDYNRNQYVESGIREDNTIGLMIDECYGGYWTNSSDCWNYQWSEDGNILSQEKSYSYSVPSLSQGNNMTSSDVSYSLNAKNIYNNSVVWKNANLNRSIKVYRKPQTPTSLIKKGSGASCTFVALTSLSDTQLSDYEYYLVFGYTDGSGVDHTQTEIRQETGTTRFDSFDSSVFNNSSNQFWVYSLWKYSDGPYITSGKRYIDGEDSTWDGSAYTQAEISSRAVGDSSTSISEICGENIAIPDFVYTTSGVKISKNHIKPGLYIVNGRKMLIK